MGFWDRLLSRNEQATSYEPAQIVQPPGYEPYVSTAGIPIADPGIPIEWAILDRQRTAVATLWRTQPNLRKVVGFVARNLASTPLHVYRRGENGSRERVRDSKLARLIADPCPGMSPYRFWESVISDGLLYDLSALLVAPGAGPSGEDSLLRIPAWRLHVEKDQLGIVTGLKYWANESKWVDIPLSEVLLDFGYSPDGIITSPVETLKAVLDVDRESVNYRRDLMANGARIPGQVLRPETAPMWTASARNNFISMLRANFAGGGKNAGQMPLMEDGMKIEALDIFKPSDTLDLEARQLSAVDMASLYYIAPELVGAREGNYSNLDAYRQMLYGPSLGPRYEAWQGSLNSQLTPKYDDGTDQYVEAFLDSKRDGSLLEQARVLQSATGGPWLTRAEVRQMRNLPFIEGSDELVVPLNVVEGGQASPTDSGTQNLADAASEVITKHLDRQQRVTKTVQSKSPDNWWDSERWDRELSDDLTELGVKNARDLAERINDGTRDAITDHGIDDAFKGRELDALDALDEHLRST